MLLHAQLRECDKLERLDFLVIARLLFWRQIIIVRRLEIDLIDEVAVSARLVDEAVAQVG